MTVVVGEISRALKAKHDLLVFMFMVCVICQRAIRKSNKVESKNYYEVGKPQLERIERKAMYVCEM